MKIYIGNLHVKASACELHDLFLRFGEVVSAKVMTDTAGRSQRHGYVDMRGIANGQKAIQQLNRLNFMNLFLDVYEVDEP